MPGTKTKKKAAIKKDVKREKTGQAAGEKIKTIGKKPAGKTLKKKSRSNKAAGKRTLPRPTLARNADLIKKDIAIEPGPALIDVPPVEEPAPDEQAIGVVTRYYSQIGVIIVQVNRGVLRIGDMIRIKGHTTDIVRQIDSMEYEHRHVDQASAGQSVGIKIEEQAREHDIVYLARKPRSLGV